MKINTWKQEQLAMLKRKWIKDFCKRFGPKSKTHCVYGHPFNKSNTRIQKTGKRAGRRFCKTCCLIRKRRFLAFSPLSAAYKERRNNQKRVDVKGTRVRPIGRKCVDPRYQISLDGPLFSKRRFGSPRRDNTLLDILREPSPDPLTALMIKEEQELNEKYVKWRSKKHDVFVLKPGMV